MSVSRQIDSLTAARAAEAAAQTALVELIRGALATTYAGLSSPGLSGIPTAPTAQAGTATQQIATTAFVNTAIANLALISIQVVESLPVQGAANIIYFVPNSGSSGNVYDEYIYVNSTYEKIGTTDVDLSGYLTATSLSGANTASAIADSDAIITAGLTKITWATIKSTLKTHFDSLYTAALLPLTGYEKPASASDVAATDSIIAAIGKLQKALDGKIGADDVDLSGLSSIYAPAAVDTVVTAAATSWTGDAAPYTIILTVNGVLADSKLDVGLSEAATDDQFTACSEAQIRATACGAGTVTLKALGTLPAVDIPILVRRVG